MEKCLLCKRPSTSLIRIRDELILGTDVGGVCGTHSLDELKTANYIVIVLPNSDHLMG